MFRPPAGAVRLTPGRRTAIAMIGIGLLVTTACGAGDEADAQLDCAEMVEAAASESEPPDQVRLLDRALQRCASYRSFTRELARYPSIIGYDPATFVELRCNRVTDTAVRDSPTCSSVIVAATTVPPTTQVELLYVGDTLDGRPVEIRPSDDVAFDGDVPAVIQQTVNIAIESGCGGVAAQRDLWADRVDDSPDGDIASVYAQHAQNVADFIQCDIAPLDDG